MLNKVGWFWLKWIRDYSGEWWELQQKGSYKELSEISFPDCEAATLVQSELIVKPVESSSWHSTSSWGLSSPSSALCLAVVLWACSDTFKALAFSSQARPKILEGSALTFKHHLCLQCCENLRRGFSRTCQDLLLSSWTVSFCSEKPHVRYVEYEFFMC